MTNALAQDRNRNASEYLRLLGSLRDELEKAMRAIADNALAQFEESVAVQQILSARLVELADQISVPLNADSAPPSTSIDIDEDLKRQILIAGDSLQKLNRGYAALLQHSSRSTALMVSLFASVRGQFQEASGPRLKYQTWSCQM
ncbi:MAG: hypothetical protein ABSD67_15370 [Terracidiphilus sp.]|jgi:hypothetical protein